MQIARSPDRKSDDQELLATEGRNDTFLIVVVDGQGLDAGSYVALAFLADKGRNRMFATFEKFLNEVATDVTASL